jgi:RNA polymerase II-associated factor 1
VNAIRTSDSTQTVIIPNPYNIQQGRLLLSSMASSSQRVVHQDYIARIRYSNALPPPPNPPKLLDIPNTGLASGQYTTPGFASRLSRDQPLNIEADAELGMPLDLVGMPGIFDGDESCK